MEQCFSMLCPGVFDPLHAAWGFKELPPNRQDLMTRSNGTSCVQAIVAEAGVN
jgi:hypothetical protein